jgi:hypothetical protein
MRSAPLSPFLLALPESVVAQPPAEKPPFPPVAPPRPAPAEPANQN